MKDIQAYIRELGKEISDIHAFKNFSVTGISTNSAKVSPGFIFTAIKGKNTDGHLFIKDAISSGAGAIIAENLKDIPENVMAIKVRNSRSAYAVACECFFDFPAREMELAAITGTNGKTTTAFITREILKNYFSDCGIISTIKYSADKDIKADRTTPSSYILQKLLRKMLDNGCHKAVMEASSHGLDQKRLGTLRFKTAVFTNLSGDHLDYHKSMEEYHNAKEKLFTEYLAPEGKAIINIDDSRALKTARKLSSEKVVTFGTSIKADCVFRIIRETASGTHAELRYAGFQREFHSPLPGIHNIYNLTGAFLASVSMGVPPEFASDFFENEFRIPGRLEKYRAPDGAFCFIDYAHTDDALENVLRVLKKICAGRLICVFGCGGDRDKAKRPRMGRVAAALADQIYITNDNPRSETPGRIIDDIIRGIPPEYKHLKIIPDRAKAISDSVTKASKKDIVLIAGKGHEEYQEVNGVFRDFSDKAELSRCFSEVEKN